MRIRYLVLVVLLAAGCGSSGVAPVSGRVTLNGQPLAHATVVFQPEEGKEPGPGSTGTTDADGRYQLRLLTTNGNGAVVGKHKVSITAYAGEGGEESSAPPTKGSVFRKALLPPEYNANTKLAFTVPARGSTSADFELKAPTK